MSDNNLRIPLLPLRGMLVFPGMEHCVNRAIKEGKQEEALKELQTAIDRFMR
jgi:Uncharacterized protein conserved in bacteria